MANFQFAQLQEFSLAGSGAIIGATTIVLKSMLDIDGNPLTMAGAFGNIGFGTLSPGNGALEEQISFTGLTNNANGTVTLTGVSSVTFLDPYTATSGLLKTHAGSTPFIISNTSGFYNKFPAKDNDETITGQWTFDNTPIVPGVVSDASTTVKGVSKLSAAPDVASNPIAVGANVWVAYAVDSVGTDAYAITPTPAIASYTAGQVFTFKAGTANTGPATLNVSGLGAKIIKKAGASSIGGNSTTQFDITLTGGTTYRYTYDGTGTDPAITATSIPTGAKLIIAGQNFTASNNGTFTVTGSGANYFEVTNASGVVESNKTLGNGYINNTVSDLSTGDILLNQISVLEYDGVYMQLTSPRNTIIAVNKYTTVSTSIGSSTTQFDITLTGGTTYRYTWDSTGTDPSLSLANNPIGSLMNFQAQNFTAANNGIFVVTGAGTNYVEVTNASGVAESNKTIGTGYVVKSGTSGWTKPSGLKYVMVEVQAGGGGGGAAGSGSSGEEGGSGGGGGGYSRKLIPASSLNLIEYYIVGAGGIGGISGAGDSGKNSAFGGHASASAGGGGLENSGAGGAGGIGSGGDINSGGTAGGGSNGSAGVGLSGGASVLGGGGQGGRQSNGGAGQVYGGGGGGGNTAGGGGATNGGAGADGIVIVTEYF